VAWIDLAEDRCGRSSGAVRSASDVAQQLNNAQSLAVDIERQRHNVDDVTSTGCRLLELTNTDHSGVKQLMASINDRFTTLNQRMYIYMNMY